MEPNPYEAPREAGYRTPQQAILDAWTKDRLLLLMIGAAAYSAMMGFVMSFVVAQQIFSLSDESVKGAMTAAFVCLIIVGWTAYALVNKSAKKNAAQITSPLP